MEMARRLVSHEDEDVSASIAGIMEQEGIELRLNAKCIALKPHPEGVTVVAECTEGAPEVIGSHVLLAGGGKPNTDGLGLEKAGIQEDSRGYIFLDYHVRTNAGRLLARGHRHCHSLLSP